MPSFNPPKKADTWVTYIGLESVATPGFFQSNPTITSGDFKVAIDDGAFANLATLPTVSPASSKRVKVALGTAETNGTVITILASDAAGNEWYDLMISFPTVTTNQFDDLANQASINTVSGYIDTEVAAIKAKTDNLPASPANESTLTTIASYIDTEVAAIKAKTDNLPTTPANESTLNTIAGYIDTEISTIVTNVASILAAVSSTGVTLSTAQKQSIADIILSRSRSNQDSTAETNSLYELIGLILQGNASSTPGSMIIPKSDGTTFNTRTLTTDANAEPITKIV